MGRIRRNIKVDGRQCWTLFDSGARNTYVASSVAGPLSIYKAARPIRSAIGGHTRETDTAAMLEGEVDGHHILVQALVIDDIGADEDGRPIEILFGALAMQQWGIRLIPEEERLDLSHYPEEFVEF